MDDRERLLVRVRAYDWFIFSKDKEFLVVPVFVDKKRRIWSIIYDTSINQKGLIIPKAVIGKEYFIRDNKYINDYKITQDLNDVGFKSCGLCHGEIMEEKHPIVDKLLQTKSDICKLDEEVIIQSLAECYSEKIAEQYQDFVSKKHSLAKEVHMDRYGSPF